MAYTPTEWATGDVITAAKLNKMEEGIEAAGGIIIPVAVPDNSYDVSTGEFIVSPDYPKPFAEIMSDVAAGVMCYAHITGFYNLLLPLNLDSQGNLYATNREGPPENFFTGAETSLQWRFF